MKTEIKYGLKAGLAYVAWNVLEFGLGLHTHWIGLQSFTTHLAVVAPTLYLVLGIQAKRTELNGVITYGQGLGTGVHIAFLMALVNMVGMAMYFEYLNPNYTQTMVDYYIKQALATDEDVNLARQIAEATYQAESVLLFSFLGTIVLGFVVSAAVAFFLRKDRPIVANWQEKWTMQTQELESPTPTWAEN